MNKAVSQRPKRRKRLREVSDADDAGWLIVGDEHLDPLVEAPPPVVEQLRYVVERLRLQDPDGLPTRIGVTSAVGGEGVDLIARTLAGVLASDADRTVCIVSLDLWTSVSSRARPGVAQIVAGEAQVDAVLLQTTEPRLMYLPPGRAELADLPGLGRSASLASALRELALRFHHVVLELPPVRVTSEALALAGHCDVCAVVVLQGVTSKNDLQTAVDSLGEDRVLGVIMNQASSKVPNFLLRAISPL